MPLFFAKSLTPFSKLIAKAGKSEKNKKFQGPYNRHKAMIK